MELLRCFISRARHSAHSLLRVLLATRIPPRPHTAPSRLSLTPATPSGLRIPPIHFQHRPAFPPPATRHSYISVAPDPDPPPDLPSARSQVCHQAQVEHPEGLLWPRRLAPGRLQQHPAPCHPCVPGQPLVPGSAPLQQQGQAALGMGQGCRWLVPEEDGRVGVSAVAGPGGATADSSLKLGVTGGGYFGEPRTCLRRERGSGGSPWQRSGDHTGAH